MLSIVVATGASSCSIFSNRPNESNSNGSGVNSEEKIPPKTQEITVYNGDTPTQYTATYGKVAQTQYNETPFSWIGTVEKFIEYEFSEPLKNAIAANLTATVAISGIIDFSCDKSREFQTINLKTLKSGGETYSLGKNVKLTSGTYRTFPYSVKIPARLLQSGKIYLSLRALELNIIEARYYFKNVTLSASFLQPS